MNNAQPIWPKAGEKVIFVGVPDFYYPMFLSMKNFCKNNLVIGQEYQLAHVDVLSSWVAVYLVGHEKEMLNWVFFKPTEKKL